MEYALDRFPQFVEDYKEYFSYLREFDEALAVRHYLRFENALLELLLRNPYRYAYFKETGAPYHAKLFRVGRSLLLSRRSKCCSATVRQHDSSVVR